MKPKTTTLPKWENVLENIAHIGEILPDAVVVGGSASAIYANHRISFDNDFVMQNLRVNFNDVVHLLETLTGWKTNRYINPVLILGNFDGVPTGIRQLRRRVPIETTTINYNGLELKLPTQAEVLRIKGFLILTRNISRDYLDFVALAEKLGIEKTWEALKHFDEIYEVKNNQSALKQLLIQLTDPAPCDIKQVDFSKFINLSQQWKNWDNVRQFCTFLVNTIMNNTQMNKKQLVNLNNNNNKINYHYNNNLLNM